MQDKYKSTLNSIKFEETQKASNLLAERIKNLIVSEQLPPKYIFPSENDFCAQLGVGRSTLREAYKELESFGFITRTKRGTYVNDSSDIVKSVPFGTSVQMSAFDDILEFRVMFESELASLAAERADADNIEAMRKCFEGMKNSSDLKELTDHDTQFHLEVARASKNKLFTNTMLMVIDTFHDCVYNAFQIDTMENIRQAIKYHEKILDAIIAKDSKLAHKLMRQHVMNVHNRVTK